MGETVLSEAIDQILKEEADERARQERREARRQHVRTLDRWLNAVETMLEEDRRTVPEPLFREIGGFLRQQAPPLHRELQRNRNRDAARVLDVLFDAQEALKTVPGAP